MYIFFSCFLFILHFIILIYCRENKCCNNDIKFQKRSKVKLDIKKLDVKEYTLTVYTSVYLHL